ncbi:hypothetical protein GU336_01500 [Lactococcus raffinolactis]|uniref:IS30 family transposase n=1 Tax=Pseudolactococcus raffinolactis TaxID=1366 RepID=A0A6H0UAY8_9LACT|nr:hypothetical protein [Lactococcus raffinolactis]QIW52942.1 hypothetical protein GU336_01500 [Lactococcus raffinolactis]
MQKNRLGNFPTRFIIEPKEVAQIEIWMNNYPRKMFNYSTPIQVYLGG